MPVAIIGSARSGTSLVARLLNMSGLPIGQASKMIAADDSNIKGYWELASIIELNERILKQFGGTSDRPPMLPQSWREDPALDPLYEEARQLLGREFSGVPLYGFKDPRATFTLPFWRKVTPDWKLVVCMRNPLEVAKSMSKWLISDRYGFAIWHLYNLYVFRNTLPEERIVVHYDDIQDDALAAINPVLRFVGLDEVSPGSPKHAELARQFDGKLRHHRSKRDEVEHEQLPSATRDLYMDILAGGKLGVIESQVRNFDDVSSLLVQIAAIETDNLDMRLALNSSPHRAAAKARALVHKLSKKNSLVRLALEKRAKRGAASMSIEDAESAF